MSKCDNVCLQSVTKGTQAKMDFFLYLFSSITYIGLRTVNGDCSRRRDEMYIQHTSLILHRENRTKLKNNVHVHTVNTSRESTKHSHTLTYSLYNTYLIK